MNIFGKFNSISLHLTPKLFLSYMNKLIFRSTPANKCLDLVKSSISCAFLNCGRSRQKGRHFGSSPSEATIGGNGTSDVISRIFFPESSEFTSFNSNSSSDEDYFERALLRNTIWTASVSVEIQSFLN